jgi:solute carrier family 25 oxoglutarate transporter 11
MMHDESHHDFYLAAQPFVVGGASAMLASSCIHPIDLSKVRLQLYATLNPGKPKPSSIGILREMIKTQGIGSIYAGLSASLMRQAVYGTARIGLHRSISNELSSRNKGKPLTFTTKMLSAITSGSIAVIIGTPFDVALVRMQADSMKPKEARRGYKNVFDAISRVAREEGFGKLYSGLIPNVLRGMSVNVGMMACYDQAKELVAQYITKEELVLGKAPSMENQLIASLIAGFTAASFSLPFDLLKSRLRKSIAGLHQNCTNLCFCVCINRGWS